MIKINDKYIKIDTKNTSLILFKNGDSLIKIYYGKRIKDSKDYLSIYSDEHLDFYPSVDDYDNLSKLISSTGDGNNFSSAIEILNKNNTFINRFKYLKEELCNLVEDDSFPHSRNKKETLKITYLDQCFNLVLEQYISTFDDNDIISFQNKIINKSNDSINVKRIMSLQMDFTSDEAFIYTFNGTWGNERQLNKTKVKNFLFSTESRVGESSVMHNPFVIVELEKQGFFGSNLIFSGNHKEILESSPLGKVRFLTGLNDYMFGYNLEVNESFTSPEAIVCYGKTIDEITSNMHNFVMNNLINSKFKNQERPILLNNWEATYFNFTKDKIINLAKTAAALGIELFVLDDGWFGKRDNDRTSLGDWDDYEEKTGGIVNLATEIKNLGLKFGIWLEPEMISFESKLYQEHPNFMMKLDDVNPIERRHQQLLDLCNVEVQDYLIQKLSELLESVKPNYVKWDCNRFMIDIYSPSLKNNLEYFYKYVKGLYRILDVLTNKFSDILFESCSAGGNRYDLGMLFYMPQIWCSDNSDAYSRIFIQEGTLYGYPESTMGAHVTVSPNKQNLFLVSLESRFNIAAIGAFGYELDIEKLNSNDISTVKNQLDFYKEYRSVLQFGNYYNIGSLFENDFGGYMVVSKNQDLAIAVIIEKNYKISHLRNKFVFKGLNENYKYEVKMRKQSNVEKYYEFIAYGDLLMEYGLDFGKLFDLELDRDKFGSLFASRMIIIKKIG